MLRARFRSSAKRINAARDIKKIKSILKLPA